MENFLLMTVGQIFQIVLASGISFAVAYVVNYLQASDATKKIVGGLFVAILTAAVVYIQSLLTPAQLNMTVLQALITAGTFAATWAANLFGQFKATEHLYEHLDNVIAIKQLKAD